MVEFAFPLYYSLTILPRPPRGLNFYRLSYGLAHYRKVSDGMRKMVSRRPVVETLESLTLLSGLGGASHHASGRAAVVAPLPNPLHLTGSLNGSYTVKGSRPSATGSGSVDPLGKVKISGAGLVLGTSGAATLNLPAKKGKLILRLDLLSTDSGLSGRYTIVGGTRAAAGETGSGLVSVTAAGSTSKGRFTATFS